MKNGRTDCLASFPTFHFSFATLHFALPVLLLRAFLCFFVARLPNQSVDSMLDKLPVAVDELSGSIDDWLGFGAGRAID